MFDTYLVNKNVYFKVYSVVFWYSYILWKNFHNQASWHTHYFLIANYSPPKV